MKKPKPFTLDVAPDLLIRIIAVMKKHNLDSLALALQMTKSVMDELEFQDLTLKSPFMDKKNAKN